MKAFFAEQFSKYQELEAKVKSNEWHDPDCEANKQTMAQIYELTRDLANIARYYCMMNLFGRYGLFQKPD